MTRVVILMQFNANERAGTDELVDVISEAIRGWLVGVRESVDSVVAAGGLDVGLEVYRVIAPALGAEFIATAASDAPVTGVERLDSTLSWPEGVDGPATVEELLAEYPGTFAGVDPSQVSFVVASPVWRGEFDRYLKTAVNLVVGMEDTAFRKMSSLLSDVKLGGRFEQLEAVRSFLSWEAEGGYEGWMRRAERIARTELQVARSHAVFTSARMLADAGVRVRKMWNAAHDERTREWHAAADGQVRDVNDPFDVGGEPLMFPGDREHGSAENVIQCVVGSTRVAGPGQDVLAAYRRPVTGRFIKLTVGDGRVLTCTPNHPILTPAGYVPAERLGEGDYVMATASGGVPQVDNVPPRIDEAFDAVRSLGFTSRVGGTALDFHGDGSEEEEVEIVTPNGELRDRFNAAFGAGFGEDSFVGLDRAERALLDAGGGLAGGDGVVDVGSAGSLLPAATPDGGVSRTGEVASLGVGEFTHSDGVSLAAVPDRESEFGEVAGYNISGDSEDARHLQHARSLGVEATELVSVESYFGVHDVYNLETSGNYFLANGITVHNCRCAVSYVPAEDGVDLREVAQVTSLEDVNRMIEETMMSDSVVASGVKGLSWEGVLAPLGEATGDGRVFEEDGAFRFRQFPLPLLWQESTGEGHDTSRVVGTIEGGEVEGGRVTAYGTVFEDEEKLVALLEKGVVRPSVDLCDMEAEVRGENEREERLHVLSATVMAATLVATPAFENVGIELSGGVVDVEPDGLVASAGVEFEEYNAGAFSNPKLDGPTPLTVTDGGLVFGHLALWDTCHVGQPRRCVTPPRSESGYAAFHQSTIRTQKGMLAVGRLTVGGGHADTRAGVRAAAEHYDTTGSCWAFVRAGEDEFGVWVAGQVNKDCDAARVREGASAPLSGDWRRVGGGMELVAALSVSTPGFPVRREFAEAGVGMSLVATAGVPTEKEPGEVDNEAASSGTYAETMRALREFFGDDGESAVDDSLAGRWEAARSVFAKDSLEAAAVVFDDDDESEEVE